MKYSIVGLGKLGASMAAAIAKRGLEVIGVDINSRAVELLSDGRAPVQETDLDKTIHQNRQRLRATLSHSEAVLNSDVTFVIVPTPSDRTGLFSLQYAKWAFREIGKALAQKDHYHNVVLTSTVAPGSTRYVLKQVLEQESDKVCGRDFGLCYSPQFIALGSIIRDFLNPNFTLVGQIDDRAGEQLKTCYAAITENDPPCRRMSLENAELTKIAVNTFVTSKIVYANMLADLCERLPGGDIDVVSNALGLDSRIGREYLSGGLGYGGPCFPRDNLALAAFGRAVSSSTDLAETTDRMNRARAHSLTERLQSLVKPGSTVAILGLAYKPYSHVVEESQAVHLASGLAEAGMRVVGYDPLAQEEARHALSDKVVLMNDLRACIEQADAVVIATPDPQFAELDATKFKPRQPPVVVFDCWRLLHRQLGGAGHVRYVPLGVGDHTHGADLNHLWNTDAT